VQLIIYFLSPQDDFIKYKSMNTIGEKSKAKEIKFQKPNVNQDQAKTIAIIAYITLVGLLIAWNKNKKNKHAFASFHIRQMFGICCVGLVLFSLGFIPNFGLYIYSIGMLFVVLLWVLGLLNAVNGEERKLLGLGSYFQKWFKSIA